MNQGISTGSEQAITDARGEAMAFLRRTPNGVWHLLDAEKQPRGWFDPGRNATMLLPERTLLGGNHLSAVGAALQREREAAQHRSRVAKLRAA